MLRIIMVTLIAYALTACMYKQMGSIPAEWCFDQPLPGNIAERFIPSFPGFNTRIISGISFSADGKQMAFSMLDDNKVNNIYVSDYVSGAWSLPKALPGKPEGKHWGFPSYSLEGGYDIYFTEGPPIRQKVFLHKGGLQNVPNPPNVEVSWGITHSTDHLAFFGAASKNGDSDLFLARRTENGYTRAEALPRSINSEADETRPFVSADGDLIIFESTRGGGKPDIYVSFAADKSDETAWTAPVSLGPNVNTSALEDGPWVSSDGKVLFFRRQIEKKNAQNTSNMSHIYWVNMSLIHALDPR